MVRTFVALVVAEDELISILAADQVVRAPRGEQAVVALLAEHDVVASAAEQVVVAEAAIDGVATGAAEQRVVAGPLGGGQAEVAVDDVVAVVALGVVVAGAAVDSVIVGAAAQLVVAGPAGAARVIGLPAAAAAIIARQPEGEPDDYVFAPAKGRGPLNLSKPWRAVRAEAGLPEGIGLHGLRHSLASHMAMGGAQAAEIMQALGHRDMATSQRYVHWAAQARQTLAERAAAVALAGLNRAPKAEVLPLKGRA